MVELNKDVEFGLFSIDEKTKESLLGKLKEEEKELMILFNEKERWFKDTFKKSKTTSLDENDGETNRERYISEQINTVSTIMTTNTKKYNLSENEKDEILTILIEIMEYKRNTNKYPSDAYEKIVKISNKFGI